ncbi:MAG TPA: CaiB/BaiF CoA-transferase family protein [Acidimicrobiia bacterium]|nr:CaiB/BaiF CoA-transferase family protein [Acidimicrobiia bacterium]
MISPEPGTGPLAGIRVVDLTHARAGPTCTRQLADLGADVIRVSHPKRGFRLGGSDDQNLMRDKRSTLVDLACDEGREVFFRLCDTADVVVENFRPAVKRRLAIDPEAVWARNPRIVYASISGFGQTGPYADRPAVDQITQGMAGLMSVTGPPGTGPWRVGIAISDTAAGTFLTQGILAALIARGRTGRGQWVHTSLIESLVNYMDFQAARWLNEGEVPGQAGNDHPTVFPMGTYRTGDGLINISAMGTWPDFCETVGAPGLAVDPRFAEADARLRNRDDLRVELESVLASATTDDWVLRLNAAGYPAGPVLRVDEAFADPQVRHLDMVAVVHHAIAGEVSVLRHPVNLTDTPTSVRAAASVPGSDTASVLAELGYDAPTIAALLEAGAVAGPAA